MAQQAQPESEGRGGIIARIARSQGLLVPWSVAFVLALATALFGPIGQRWEWFSAVAGLSLIVTFVVHVIIGRADGFLIRVSTAAVGCVMIVGIVSLIAGLFSVVAAGFSIFPA